MIATVLAPTFTFMGASKASADNSYTSPELSFENQNSYKFTPRVDYPIYQSNDEVTNDEEEPEDYSTEVVIAFWASMLVAGVVIMKKTSLNNLDDIDFEKELVEVEEIQVAKEAQIRIIGPEDDPNFWPPQVN